MLSAGIGATPVLAMLHAIAAANENSMLEIWWCYGARNGREHPFADEVRKVLSRLPNSHSFFAYSKPEDEDRQGEHYDALGRLDLPSLRRIHVPKAADFYLSGPAGFLAEFTAALKAWDVPGSRIHAETFGAGSSITPGIVSVTTRVPHPPAEPMGVGPRVSFTRSGLTVSWDSRYQSLLEFAEACDVPVRWSCRVGVCHMCESGMIDGEISDTPEPLDRPNEGNVLICCSTRCQRLNWIFDGW